ELMPGPRRPGPGIAGLDRSHFVADEAMAAPAQDQHRVHVLVPFQAGETAGRHLEIAQLALELRIAEQHLPRDRLEQGALVFLVRKLLHAFPAVILRLAVDRSLARGHHSTRTRIGGLRPRRPMSLGADFRAPRAARRRSAT